MTRESDPANSAETAPLQFDKAEFTQPQNVCAVCQKQIADHYYSVNGSVVCDHCKGEVVGASNQGTGASRFFRALVAGSGAAAAGSLVYFAISKLTGYEFGLIAILVGFAVGGAVRWGCYGRGGWRYQTLAMVLTYLAIVSTYIPAVIEGLQQAGDAEVSSNMSGGLLMGSPPATPPPAEPAESAEATQLGVAGLVLALLVVLVIACIAPFLAGLQNILGLIIIGIGLWEAWKINRKRELTITGPHPLAVAPASPPVAT